MTQTCPRCGSKKLRWATFRRTVPVDVRQCMECQQVLEEQDWTAPLVALQPGHCTNCGERRGDNDVCTGCGLSRDEDQQVHDELRHMVAPGKSLLEAARMASMLGRRVIALKLASAASLQEESPQDRDVARALRVWLLAAVGEANAALEDARAWIDREPDPTALAWASLGQQLQHHGFPGAAADAYAKTLEKDDTQHAIRARRAKLMLGMNREGQALREASQIFDAQADDASINIAIEVAEYLCDFYEERHQDEEIVYLIERAGPYCERSGMLLAQRARLAAKNGDIDAARRDLKSARRLYPDLPIYDRVQKLIKPPRSSWWRW